MLSTIWNTVFKQPIYLSLEWLSGMTGNVGVAIILLTIVIQLVLLPLRMPSIKSSHKMRLIKPELDKLKEKHKGDNTSLAKAQMELYKEHGISPFGSILPTLLSIPIIIALYRVLLSSLDSFSGISTHFLWLDVTSPDPYYILPFLVGGAQFILSSFMFITSPNKSGSTEKNKDDKSQSPEDVMQSVQSQMKFVFPLMSAFITATLPAGVGLYWLTSVSFAIIQQKWVRGQFPSSDATTV